MLQTLAILAGLSASHGLGYGAGVRVLAQAERPMIYAATWYDSADKYVRDGFSYGFDGHLRLGRTWFAGPGLSVSHTSTSQWDKTSVRPAAVLGWRKGTLSAWGEGFVYDTSPNRIRGLSATLQGRAGPILVQASVQWLTYLQGSGWGVRVMAGYRL